MLLTPEELLAGKDLTTEVAIPSEILNPTNCEEKQVGQKKVQLKPLTVRDVQLIAKAAKDDEILTSILMVKQALVQPELKQSEIAEMHSGLVGFLVEQINRISGLHSSEDEMLDLVKSPIAQAFFVLAREFNWTPEQVRELTIGQILGYLEMLNQTRERKIA